MKAYCIIRERQVYWHLRRQGCERNLCRCCKQWHAPSLLLHVDGFPKGSTAPTVIHHQQRHKAKALSYGLSWVPILFPRYDTGCIECIILSKRPNIAMQVATARLHGCVVPRWHMDVGMEQTHRLQPYIRENWEAVNRSLRGSCDLMIAWWLQQRHKSLPSGA